MKNNKCQHILHDVGKVELDQGGRAYDVPMSRCVICGRAYFGEAASIGASRGETDKEGMGKFQSIHGMSLSQMVERIEVPGEGARFNAPGRAYPAVLVQRRNDREAELTLLSGKEHRSRITNQQECVFSPPEATVLFFLLSAAVQYAAGGE